MAIPLIPTFTHFYKLHLDRCKREGRCPYCGAMLWSTEQEQGYHNHKPCNLYGEGRVEEALAWERENA